MSLIPQPEEALQARPERRLRALAAISRAVAGAHELAEVLEIAAEQTRDVLGVSQLSISRWELGQGCLQTLINVGELSAGEERWPTNERYPLADYPKAHAVLRLGEPHVTARDDADADPAELELLERLGKETCAAVPIIFDGQTWGELWAATSIGSQRLARADIEFIQAVCSQVALAIGRAERFSRLVEAAYRDELTGIANRRAFDERLDAALSGDGAGSVVVLLGDVDGLKDTNDRHGHAAGDAVLRAVGRTLRHECGSEVLAARIGGDEFCVLLQRAGHADGERLARTLTTRLAEGDPPVSVSWGVAAQTTGGTTPNELLRAADAAQYEVKRRRREAVSREAGGRRELRDGTLAMDAEAVLVLLRDGLDLLDRSDPAHRVPAVESLIAERLGPDPGSSRRGIAADAVRLLRCAAAHG